MIILKDFRTRQHNKTQFYMLLAREQMKAGKKVLFAYQNLKQGIEQLHKYFPGALIEIVGESGLQVWERNKK